MSDNNILNELETVTANDFERYTTAEWHDVEFKIKRILSVTDMMTFVDTVVNACFAGDTSEYLPELKDFITRCCVVEHYTEIELPNDISKKYDVVYGSDIVSFILKHVEHGQFNGMLAAIDRKIEHLAQSNIEAVSMQLNELISAFSSLEEKLSEAFTGIDGDTITKIAGAISDGSFDETKLVKAFADNARHASDNVKTMIKDSTNDTGDSK